MTPEQQRAKWREQYRARRAGAKPKPSPWRIGPVCPTARAARVFAENRKGKAHDA